MFLSADKQHKVPQFKVLRFTLVKKTCPQTERNRLHFIAVWLVSIMPVHLVEIGNLPQVCAVKRVWWELYDWDINHTRGPLFQWGHVAVEDLKSDFSMLWGEQLKFRLSLLYLSGSQSLRGQYLETSARTTNLIYMATYHVPVHGLPLGILHFVSLLGLHKVKFSLLINELLCFVCMLIPTSCRIKLACFSWSE